MPVIRLVVASALLAVVFASPARAQRGPVAFDGPERGLSIGVVGSSSRPAVGRGGDAFVVAWNGSIEGQGSGIFFRLFDAEGRAIGPPVLGASRGSATEPRLAERLDGRFGLGQWETSGNDRILRLGLYRADGSREGGLRTLSEPQRGLFPPAAALGGDSASGRLVAAWARAGVVGSGEPDRVAAQVFSPVGSFLGERIAVSGVSEPVGDVAVAMDRGGSFLVAWDGGGSGGASRTLARRFGPDRDALGGVLAVADTPSEGAAATVGAAGAGYVVAFTTVEAGSQRHLWLRRIRSDGTLAPPVLVAESVALFSEAPHFDLAADPAGSLLVVWAEPSDLEPGADVFARAFDPTGAPLSEAFRLNADPAGDQRLPAVASIGPSRFAVAWSSRSFGGAGATEVRGRLLRVDPARAPRAEAPPRALEDFEVACDEARLNGFLARLEVAAPNVPAPGTAPGVTVGLTRSGDFAGVAHVVSGTANTVGGVPESLLAFGTNPEETPLLRNPERPPLASVSLTRIPSASDLVAADSTGLLRVVLNPTLDLADPAPEVLLRIDNLAGGAGVTADARPGRGFESLRYPCHEKLVDRDARVGRVLRRIVRGEAVGAAAVEAAIYRGEEPGLFRIDLYPKGPAGESLGRLAAELFVEHTPGGLLWTGELRSRPRCGEGITRGCTSVVAPTVLKLVQPTFGRPSGAPREVRLDASGGEDPPLEVRFLWEELLAGSTWLGGTP
jgi:hypothetical protein